eukprot:scaffold10712_cov28-Tisochrysis_lutea.AAC.1
MLARWAVLCLAGASALKIVSRPIVPRAPTLAMAAAQGTEVVSFVQTEMRGACSSARVGPPATGNIG